MSSLDPTTVRISTHFLLSDFIGCRSVYAYGYPNVFDARDTAKLREGRALAEHVLEGIVEYSPISICYGYISPDLSRRIVKYQDPNKPSYHRWDLPGAACDVVIHEHDLQRQPPVLAAFWLDENYPMSRTISYSESMYLCLATSAGEIASVARGGQSRHALYENRYPGTSRAKPEYISYPSGAAARTRAQDAARRIVTAPDYDWRGAGYPTYHAGGQRAFEHVRVGDFCMYSDFLFAAEATLRGRPNAWPMTDDHIDRMQQVGALYDGLLRTLGVNRLSVVRAYESPRWSLDRAHHWTDGFALHLAPPVGTPASRVADAARFLGYPSVGVTEGADGQVAVIHGAWEDHEGVQEVRAQAGPDAAAAPAARRGRLRRR